MGFSTEEARRIIRRARKQRPLRLSRFALERARHRARHRGAHGGDRAGERLLLFFFHRFCSLRRARVFLWRRAPAAADRGRPRRRERVDIYIFRAFVRRISSLPKPRGGPRHSSRGVSRSRNLYEIFETFEIFRRRGQRRRGALLVVVFPRVVVLQNAPFIRRRRGIKNKIVRPNRVARVENGRLVRATGDGAHERDQHRVILGVGVGVARGVAVLLGGVAGGDLDAVPAGTPRPGGLPISRILAAIGVHVHAVQRVRGGRHPPRLTAAARAKVRAR